MACQTVKEKCVPANAVPCMLVLWCSETSSSILSSRSALQVVFCFPHSVSANTDVYLSLRCWTMPELFNSMKFHYCKQQSYAWQNMMFISANHVYQRTRIGIIQQHWHLIMHTGNIMLKWWRVSCSETAVWVWKLLSVCASLFKQTIIKNDMSQGWIFINTCLIILCTENAPTLVLHISVTLSIANVLEEIQIIRGTRKNTCLKYHISLSNVLYVIFDSFVCTMWLQYFSDIMMWEKLIIVMVVCITE